MQQQMRQMQQAHEAQTQQGAPPSGGNERQLQQLIMKGFDKIEVFSGGEEQWQNWSWKIQTAVSGMNEEFADANYGRNGRNPLVFRHGDLFQTATCAPHARTPDHTLKKVLTGYIYFFVAFFQWSEAFRKSSLRMFVTFRW